MTKEKKVEPTSVGITVLLVKTITFKVAEEKARLIQSRARQERVSVSEYLRRGATGVAPGTLKPRRIRALG